MLVLRVDEDQQVLILARWQRFAIGWEFTENSLEAFEASKRAIILLYCIHEKLVEKMYLMAFSILVPQ